MSVIFVALWYNAVTYAYRIKKGLRYGKVLD